MVIDIIIIALTGAVIYCYGIYPYAIQLVARILQRPWRQDKDYIPSVSIIVAAHNEEAVIHRLFDSLLALDYPYGQSEIIIASDGSTDRTNDIIAEYAQRHEQIKPLYFAKQRGKMSTLNDAVRHATGDILFFADADVTLSRNTLRAHVRHHADAQIGLVGGMYRIIDRDGAELGKIEHDYATLEQRIRSSESRFASTMNVFGGNYSMKRELWQPLPSSLVHDDMFVVFSVISQGKRVISDPETIAYDEFARNVDDEFSRKVRSASRGYHTLSYFPDFIFFQRIPESFLLWSHKILRWLSPLLMILAGTLALWQYLRTSGVVYGIFVLFLVLSAAIGCVTYFLEKKGRSLPLFGKLGWFVIMNFAYVVGTWRYITGRDKAIWKKAARAAST